MGKEEFLEYLKEASLKFDKWMEESERVKVVSHIDADGLSSATLFLIYLYEKEKIASISFKKYLDEESIKDIYSRDYNIYVFLDFGSSNLGIIKKYSFGRRTLVIDHHRTSEKTKISNNIIHVNPNLFGVDGSKEISTSGIVYLFLKNISFFVSKHSYISLIGAIGDIQETKEGFQGLNKEILNELIENGIIEIKKGLRIPGIFSRPLHKALEYSTELIIPGVTGSEEGAIKLLQEAGIPLKRKGDWIRYKDLSDEEARKLVTAIVLRRLREKMENAEDVLSNLYILKKSNDISNELSEISNILNACGRLGKYSVGIGFLLGDERMRDMALDAQIEYKKEILAALKMIKEKRAKIEDRGKVIIIDFQDKIRDTLVSPIASILFNGKYFPEKKVVIVCANEDNKVKISIRCKETDISKIVENCSKKFGGVGGGHDVAAGASIPREKLEEFIRCLIFELRKENIYL